MVVLAIIVCGIVFEAILIYLFPYSELAGMVNYPIAIFVSLLSGLIYYFLLKRIKGYIKHVLLCFMLLFQFYVQIRLMPQSRGSIIRQMISYAKVFYNYDLIHYQQYNDSNYEERIAFIYKFRDRLPDRFIFISMDSSKKEPYNPTVYRLEQINQHINYEDQNLSILETDTTSILIVNENENKVAHVFPKGSLKPGHGGRNEFMSIDVSYDQFAYDQGIETLFYKFLSFTKP